MIKALLEIGDIHLRKKSFFEFGLSQFINWFDQTFPDEAKENTEILLAGDVVDKIALLPDVAADAIRLSNVFHKKAKNVYAILGNHDYGLHKYKVLSSKKLLQEVGIIVIDDLQVLQTANGFKVLCLPWVYGITVGKVNEFVNSYKGEEFDSVCSHWEIEPMFDNEYLDLSEVNTKSFACGHIHSHKTNEKYLGSILPNSVAEGKEMDNSVVKMLCKDFEAGKSKERVLDIPSFVSVKEVTINSLEELESLERTPSIFYKVFTENFSEKAVRTQAELTGLNLYSYERIVPQSKEIENQKVEIKEYSKTTPEDLLNMYKDALEITDDEMGACVQVIKSVRQGA